MCLERFQNYDGKYVRLYKSILKNNWTVTVNGSVKIQATYSVAKDFFEKTMRDLYSHKYLKNEFIRNESHSNHKFSLNSIPAESGLYWNIEIDNITVGCSRNWNLIDNMWKSIIKFYKSGEIVQEQEKELNYVP